MINVILIITGALLVIICGLFYVATHKIIKNQESWDDFMKQCESKNLPAPEETIYQLVIKMNFWFGMGLIFGLLILFCGILLKCFA